MRRLLLAAAVLTAACSGSREGRGPASGVMSGLDALVADGYRPLRGKRVGLITDASAVDRRGRTSSSLIAGAPGVTLAVVIPARPGRIEDMRKAVGEDKLAGLDVVVFDAQDLGARFDPTMSVMAVALEEAKKAGADFLVLDRPNPIRGDLVEGPILEDPTLRFVAPSAFFQVPVRHGLTAGELALWHNKTALHPHLSVVKLRGWKRAMWHDDTGIPWVPAAVDEPAPEALPLYPGLGLFEASNLSVGRGTPAPFRWIGAPWLKAEEAESLLKGSLDGVEFSVQDYTPARGAFAGQRCHGLLIKVVDRDAVRPLAVFRLLALTLRELHPAELEWHWDAAARMVGVKEFRLLWETNAGNEAFMALFDKGPRDFESQRRAVLLY